MMMETPEFKILQSRPVKESPDRSAATQRLNSRNVSITLRDFKQSAEYYQPDEALITAVNMALAVGAPLLVTGGTGYR